MTDTQTLPPTRAMIGKWSVDRYVGLIRRWMIGAMLLVALLVLAQQRRELIVAVEALAVIGLAWLVARRDGGKVESLTTGVFAGIGLGLAASVSKYILNPTITNGLLIIVETVLTTVLAALAAVSTVLIITLIRQSKH
ncbi:MAG: hypothetical protein AAB619_04055 [Patescibacteria group bacterium]